MHVYMYVCLFFGYMFVLASMLLVANMYIYIYIIISIYVVRKFKFPD